MEEAQYKNKLYMYPWYDYQGIEGELTRMAAKGWQLDSITGSIWFYKRAEPAEKRFEAIFCKNARPHRSEPTEEQQELEALCEEAGWEKVGQWKKMVIFSNADKDAAPLETDQYAKFESVRRSSKRMLIGEIITLISLVVMMPLVVKISMINNPYYGKLNIIYYGIVGLLALVIVTTEIGGYFKWLKRTRANIESGNFCAETAKAGRKVQSLSLALFGFNVLVFIVCVVIWMWIG